MLVLLFFGLGIAGRSCFNFRASTVLWSQSWGVSHRGPWSVVPSRSRIVSRANSLAATWKFHRILRRTNVYPAVVTHFSEETTVDISVVTDPQIPQKSYCRSFCCYGEGLEQSHDKVLTWHTSGIVRVMRHANLLCIVPILSDDLRRIHKDGRFRLGVGVGAFIWASINTHLAG